MKYVLERKVGDWAAGEEVVEVRRVDGAALVKHEKTGRTLLVPLSYLKPVSDGARAVDAGGPQGEAAE